MVFTVGLNVPEENSLSEIILPLSEFSFSSLFQLLVSTEETSSSTTFTFLRQPDRLDNVFGLFFYIFTTSPLSLSDFCSNGNLFGDSVFSGCTGKLVKTSNYYLVLLEGPAVEKFYRYLKYDQYTFTINRQLNVSVVFTVVLYRDTSKIFEVKPRVIDIYKPKYDFC